MLHRLYNWFFIHWLYNRFFIDSIIDSSLTLQSILHRLYNWFFIHRLYSRFFIELTIDSSLTLQSIRPQTFLDSLQFLLIHQWILHSSFTDSPSISFIEFSSTLLSFPYQFSTHPMDFIHPINLLHINNSSAAYWWSTVHWFYVS